MCVWVNMCVEKTNETFRDTTSKHTHSENAVRIKDNPIESDCETKKQAANVRHLLQVRVDEDEDFT